LNIIDMVTKNARLYPDDIAFVEVKPVTKARKDVTWAQFSNRINRLAAALKDRSIGKGDKVLLLGRNSINWLEAYFAVIKTGAWVVPLNFRFTSNDINFCAGVAEAVAFILDEEYIKIVLEVP